MKSSIDQDRPAAAASSLERLRDALACGGASALALIRLYRLVADNAVDVLYGDPWDTLAPLFAEQGPLACFFRQHGPHRLGLGGVVDWYLFNSTGWDVRAESWACFGALTLATILAIALSVRLRGHLSWRDAAFPLVLLSPVSWETMLLTPFLAHSILPLLIVMLLATTWAMPTSKTQITAIGLIGSVALFSGFGFCGAFAALSLGLLQIARPAEGSPSLRWRLLPVGLFLVALGVFLYGYVWDPAVPGWRFPVPNWWDYARFPALMFTSLLSWRAITPLSTAVGGTILALCFAAWIRATLPLLQGQKAPRARTIWFLITTSLLYAGFTAIGRLPTGIEAAFMWRYTPLMMPAICGLLLAADEYAFQRKSAPHLRTVIGLLGILLAGAIWFSPRSTHNAEVIAFAKRAWVDSYLETRDLKAANATSRFWVYPASPDSPMVAGRLQWLERHRLSFFRPRGAPPQAETEER